MARRHMSVIFNGLLACCFSKIEASISGSTLKIKNFVVLVLFIFFSSASFAHSEVCVVPLQLVNIGSNDDPHFKLGINVGLGGGQPRLYEFDTGGPAFWAAYNANLSQKDQWWGATQLVSANSMSLKYTSGNHYTANLVKTNISFYQPKETQASNSLCSSNLPININQITTYTDSDPKKVDEWNKCLNEGCAPLEKKFWGDFGAALFPVNNIYNSAGAYTVLPQVFVSHRFPFTGSNQGFIVHVGKIDSNYVPVSQPYVQIGFTAQDQSSFKYFFPMNRFCANISSSNQCNFLPWYSYSTVYTQPFSEQLFNAQVTITSNDIGNQILSPIGVTMDTGAPGATIWQISGSTVDKNYLKDPSLITGNPTPIYSGIFKDNESLFVSPLINNVTQPPKFILLQTNTPVKQTIDANMHAADAPNAKIPYVNTGIFLFTEWDVLYDISSGLIGFRPANTSSP